ncbi:MAG: metal-dependent transcriptional regulator [Bacteroidales bacterium]
MEVMSQLMVHPGIMLLSGVLVLAVLLGIFWPEKGGLAILSKFRRNNQRVLLEDALKFMFDCEYRDKSCGMNSLAGNLNISADKCSQLIERLNSLGLISENEQSISLTYKGRSYALRIIRVHRIWESYLADETGLEPAEWHSEADTLEHQVTSQDTEELAARMGHPVFDPHGDPIPTPGGELPRLKGKPLSQMKNGEIGRITHIEDEPRNIYEQLVVQGLYPGMQVYATDVTGHKIVFAADGDECTLTPLFASQITVEVIKEEVPIAQKYDRLSSLEIGERAEVAGISPNCRGQQRRRLMDLGIIPGSQISAEMKSASGDPVGFRIMGTTIGIRKKQADMVFIIKNRS